MRADKRTRTGAQDEIFSDFDITFAKNPVTGALARVTNDAAVKSSIRNLILANRGEWAHHPQLGSKIYHMLFEPLEDSTAQMVRDVIIAALRFEPRAKVHGVRVTPNYSKDGYDVQIVFTTINSTRPVEFTDFLKRVR
jgi:phage baseplate assembly protein W